MLVFNLQASSFVGGSIGASKVGYDRTTNIGGYSTSYSQQHRYDLYGSLKAGSSCGMSDRLVLGTLAEGGLEKSKRLEKTLLTTITANRMYVFNLLATFGYKGDYFIPYLIGGVSYTKFKLEHKLRGKPEQTKYIHALGWGLGGGIEYEASDKVSYDIQYLYTYYGERKRRFDTYITTPALYVFTPESYQLLSIGIKIKI